MLSIEIGADGTVVLAGRLDASQAASAQAALDQTHGRVTLDCRQLDYLSSAGLGVLLKSQKRLMTNGGGLRLTGVNRALEDIFVYSGFDKILQIVPAS
jgi:anti-sigma B factor antagonist